MVNSVNLGLSVAIKDGEAISKYEDMLITKRRIEDLHICTPEGMKILMHQHHLESYTPQLKET